MEDPEEVQSSSSDGDEDDDDKPVHFYSIHNPPEEEVKVIPREVPWPSYWVEPPPKIEERKQYIQVDETESL